MLRATLKSLLSRKLRLVLSGLAVILGVMFVSGALVLTDTLGRSFEALFSTAYSNVDVNLQGRVTSGEGEGGAAVRTPVPDSVVSQVAGLPGVASATGTVFEAGAQVIDPATGKVMAGFGQQHFGTNWTGETALVHLREGHAPRSDSEVAINAGLADSAGFHVGDTVSVITRLAPKKTPYTVAGIFGYSGGRDSLAGETTVAFTTPVAQRVVVGQAGAFNSIDVTAAKGVSPGHLRDTVRAAVGDRYDVQTGAQLAKAQTDQVKQGLSFVNYVFLGFAGVALLVGVFLILNTFSIIVAQRTRELALMRALGASRRQVIGSVITEAVVIGLVAAVVGLGLGIGVGTLLAWVFGNIGGSLALAGVGVPASAVIAAFAVVVGFTVLAALFPALRASRVPPVAAMSDVATPDRPLTRLTVSGAALLLVGGGTLAWGLTGRAHGATLWTIIGGLVLTLVAVALLTPLISRPVVSVLGRALAWRLPGELGRRNSARNPRRTAITAAALMVGVALVTGISTVYLSAARSITSQVETGLKAELVVAGVQSSAQAPTFDPAVLDRMRAVSGVRTVVGTWSDAAQVAGRRTFLSATDDLPALVDLTRTGTASGSSGTLRPDTLVVDDQTAKQAELVTGSTVTVRLARAAPATYRVAGIYRQSTLLRGYVLPSSAATGFRAVGPNQALVEVDPGADVGRVKTAIDRLLADSPEVSVQNRSNFVKQQTGIVNTILVMVQVLLLLAMLIAVLGVINTLVLSVIERTREIGLLRAIGLRRGQTASMITVESVVISVFGALLGVAVGAGLGASVVRALQDQGLSDLAFPWTQMAVYVVAAAFVGVVAAIIPAVRAARLNVLGAIAYE